ncbi:MAG: DUF4139 domain-containing protein, partial [Planctomycetes bacterium]|nr:DUF4139 domain-containing protein [Planctomycetota bacterium]
VSRSTWRFAAPAEVTERPADTAEVAQLRHVIAEATAARERARLRARLASAANTLPADRDKEVLSAPEAIQARLAFASANADSVARDEAAADQAMESAKTRLAELDEPVRATAAQRETALEIPDAGGKRIEVTYRLPQASWGPAYRLEVAGDQVRLVLLARAEMSGDAWGAVPITFSSRAPDRALTLRPLAIPQLGVGDTVEGFTTPRAQRQVKYGGSKASESSVDGVLRSATFGQAPDGSWGAGRFRTASTALRTLAFLGAGYDHQTPNKYKHAVKLAIDVLVGLKPEDLPLNDLALTTTVICEALAMTGDAALKPVAVRDVEALRVRAFGTDGIVPAAARSGALDGPMVAVNATMAFKSALSAGLDIGDALMLVRDALPIVEQARDRRMGRIASLTIRTFCGMHPRVELAEAQRWAAAVPEWFKRGEVEAIYLAAMVTFQSGGDAWKVYNAVARDFLVTHENVDGTWTVPHPAGADVGIAYCQLALEIYYRYALVNVGTGGGAGFSRSPIFAPIPEIASAEAASNGWPMRWTPAGAVTLLPGARAEVELAAFELPGHVALTSIPQQEDSVWRALATRNPTTQPLPGADAVVVVDGHACGTTPVPFTLPGKELSLALGVEPGVRVQRIAKENSDDGFRSRTLSVAITYKLIAPDKWTRAVAVLEPVPLPEAGVTLVVPGMDHGQLERRLREDPLWHLDLHPEAEQTLRYDVTYPASMRPFLEYR